jgi:competence protein ComEA
MTWSPAAQRVLFVFAAALFAGSLLAVASRRPLTHAVPDDPRLELLIDLNRATPLELEALPGVGPALAARIAAHRAARGPFRRVEDLREVPGVGEKLANSLQPYVTAGTRESPVPPP